MYGNNNQPVIKTDKFGNSYQDVLCTDAKDSGYCVGYVKLGGKTYKLDVSPNTGTRSKGKHAGKSSRFVKVTLMKNQTQQNRSM